uniref:C-C motif chemokine n=1 Tax=Mustela putorius furo TaxID=9669 RepID=M3YX67_MUSPF
MEGPACSTMKSFPVGFLLLLIFILSVHSGVATRMEMSYSLPRGGLCRETKGTPLLAPSSPCFLGGSDIAKFCCFKYSHKILPWKSVHSYHLTRNSCPQQAVIFTTKKGHKVCAQPKEKWVRRYVSLLRKQQ